MNTKLRGKLAGLILALTWGILAMQCDFGLPTKVVMPTWQITLTIPLVSDNYPFDGLLSSDTTGTIQVYGDSVDTNSDGIMDILLPDTLSDYPGGLYITLENDLPPITLPEDMFSIPGQEPMALGVGPIEIGSMLPEELDSGIHVGPVDTVITMAALGFNIADILIRDIPDATCDDLSQTRNDTIRFEFGSDATDLNVDQDVYLPGYETTIEGSIPATADQGGCLDCGTFPATFVCDTSYTYSMTAFVAIPETPLPRIRQAYALLPDPSILPADAPIESFESVTISDGSISSIINSQMPLSSSNTGLVVYTKRANGDTTHLHSHYFNTISPYMSLNEDSTQTSSLVGVALYDSLIVEFGGSIDATAGDTLYFPRGVEPFFHYNFSLDINGFESIQINMKDTTISFLQPMNTSQQDEGSGQAFSVNIVSATFKDNVDNPDTNNLSIFLSNQMGLDIADLSIRLRNFYQTENDLSSGNYEILSFALPAGESADTILVLDGHLISNTTGDETPIDSLWFETVIQFSGDGGPVSLPYPPPDEMNMDVNVEMTTLRIQNLTGLFDISFAISEQNQPLSLPGLVGGITFGEAILAITLDNEFGVSPGLGLSVKGYRGDDSTIVNLDPDSVFFDAGGAGNPVSTEIRISRDHVKKTVDGEEQIVQHFASGDNIVDLMAMMPERVAVGGDAQIAPDGLSSIESGAEVTGRWRFEIPFYLSVASGGVQFMSPTFTEMAALDSSTIEQLVGSNGIPDENDFLMSSMINTSIFSDIGLGFEMRILVSDLPYFPFYNSVENQVFIAADLDLDGTIDTIDMNLDTLIMHPVVRTLELSIPAAETDPVTGLAIPGREGSGDFSHSADFNLTEDDADTTYGTLRHHKYAYLDTFIISRSETGFTDVSSALESAGLAAPTVPDSLYNLTLNEDNTQLLLMLDTTPYGELGWLIQPKTHYIAVKFLIDETENPALLPFSAGIDVTAYMQFILNSAPLFADAEADSSQ